MLTCRVALVFLSFLLPVAAVAQTAVSFERLGDQLNAGDGVRIVDATGLVRVGRVAALTPDYIALARPGGASERIAASDVREVQVRRRDDVRNGALIGAGAAAAPLCALALAQGSAAACGVWGVIFGGLGAAVGALVDAAITRRVVVFRAAPPPVAVVVWPLRAGVGAGVAIRW